MSWLSFDVGGTFIKYGYFAETGELLDKGKVPTPYEADHFFTQLAAIVEKYDESANLNGVGISFPGFIDGRQGIAIMAGALTALHGWNIKKALAEKLPRSLPIALANDANCAALAELYQGNGQGCQDLVLVTLGTGIGCGLIFGGQIREGHRFRAGESGMMLIDSSHAGFKTAHELASTRALVTNYGALRGTSPQKVTGEMVFEDDTPDVQDLLTDWSQKVATVLFNLVVTLDPEKILVGGGVSLNPKLLPLLHQALHRIPSWPDFQVPVETCQFYNDAGLIGAYHLIKKEVVS